MPPIAEDKKSTIQAIAKSYTSILPHRAPILESPQDYGLTYEDVRFKTEDGLQLAAWFIPAVGSDKLIICNHPATLNRYGFPGHQMPWSLFQDIEVRFGKVYKALHDAGYNVLVYDMRHHGESDATESRDWGQGFGDEYKDVIAAFDYVKFHEGLKRMKVGLFCPCTGGNAVLHARTKRPECFQDIKALVCVQPASINIMSKVAIDGMGLGSYFNYFAEEIENNIGIKLEDMTPHKHVQNLSIPILIAQNKDDMWTKPEDVQNTYVLIPGDDKKLLWIEKGDTRRYFAYNYFGDHPEEMIKWYDKYVK